MGKQSWACHVFLSTPSFTKGCLQRIVLFIWILPGSLTRQTQACPIFFKDKKSHTGRGYVVCPRSMPPPGLDPELPLLNSVSSPLYHFVASSDLLCHYETGLALLKTHTSVSLPGGVLDNTLCPCSYTHSFSIWTAFGITVTALPPCVPTPASCLAFFSLTQQPHEASETSKKMSTLSKYLSTKMFPFCSA